MEINELILRKPDTSAIPTAITTLLSTLGEIKVETVEDVTTAKSALDAIALYRERLKERKDEYVGGARQYVKDVDNLFKFLSDPLDKKEAEIRKAVADWKDKIDLETQKQILEAREKGEDFVPVEEPDTTVRTEMGSLSFRQILEIEIKDISQIPDEYKIINESKLKADIKAGRMPLNTNGYSSIYRNTSVNRR